MTDAARSTCTGCLHHFITYDPRFPYGCRAMNFKSRIPPRDEVRAASGMDCQMYRTNPRDPGRRPASADYFEEKNGQQKSR
jgi:hypothetical protein